MNTNNNRDAAWAPPSELLHEWNKILVAHKLSVKNGESHTLVYMSGDAETLEHVSLSSHAARKTNTSGDSNHRKGYSLVPMRSSGASNRGLYLSLALKTLSADEFTLLQRYQTQTAIELSRLYRLSADAIKGRLKRLRYKLERQAQALAALYGD